MINHADGPITATLVPEARRPAFLPTLFGTRLLIVAENSVYRCLDLLSPYDYRGGFWNFYEVANQPLFLAPASERRFRVESNLSQFQGEVSAEAAGIIATLFTFSHLSFWYESSFLVDGYERLHRYVDGHPEPRPRRDARSRHRAAGHTGRRRSTVATPASGRWIAAARPSP